MSNNLVNQSTKAISTNELRWIGPVLAVVSSGPMDLFFFLVKQCFEEGNSTAVPSLKSNSSKMFYSNKSIWQADKGTNEKGGNENEYK